MRPLNSFIKVKTWMDVSCGFFICNTYYWVCLLLSMLNYKLSWKMIQLESKTHQNQITASMWGYSAVCVEISVRTTWVWVKKPKLESIFTINPFTSSINHQPEANSSPPFTFSSRFLLSKLQPLHLIPTWPPLPSQNCQTLTSFSHHHWSAQQTVSKPPPALDTSVEDSCPQLHQSPFLTRSIWKAFCSKAQISFISLSAVSLGRYRGVHVEPFARQRRMSSWYHHQDAAVCWHHCRGTAESSCKTPK